MGKIIKNPDGSITRISSSGRKFHYVSRFQQGGSTPQDQEKLSKQLDANFKGTIKDINVWDPVRQDSVPGKKWIPTLTSNKRVPGDNMDPLFKPDNKKNQYSETFLKGHWFDKEGNWYARDPMAKDYKKEPEPNIQFNKQEPSQIPNIYDKIKSIRTTSRLNPDGTHSTHLMAQMDNYAYPTLFPNQDGSWTELEPHKAFEEAKSRKEIFQFKNEEEASRVAEGSWKDQGLYPKGQTEVSKYKLPKPDIKRRYYEENGKYYMDFPDSKSKSQTIKRPISKETYRLGMQEQDEDLGIRVRYKNAGRIKRSC